MHARRGDRANYHPLSSRLCPTGDPVGLAHRYVDTFAVRILYVADLDAIMGQGHNQAVIAAIAAGLDGVTLWVDAGIADADDLCRFTDRSAGRPVLGSESLTDPALLHRPEARGAVLSLDFHGAQLRGPREMARAPASWPPDVILMSLSRVGSQRGPDVERLRTFRRRAPHVRFHSAGGVRDPGDLAALKAAGAAGVLVASALHAGTISPRDHRPPA